MLTIALQFLEINSVRVSADMSSLLTKHHVYDKNNILDDFIDFNVEENEGTKKLIYLLGTIYSTLLNCKKFIIDEFDSKFVDRD